MNEMKYIKSLAAGPTVVVLGAMHGNERVGVAVQDLLAAEIDPKKLRGELFLIVGNPLAYEKNVRFVDTDLNRLFGNHFAELEKVQTPNNEQSRALKIAPYLAKANYLLDIHSTIKPSVPFIFIHNTENHKKLADLFETEFIVSVDSNFKSADISSSADNYVDASGAVGLTYESGWHKDELSPESVLNKTKLFLQTVGAYDFGISLNQSSTIAKHLIIYNDVIPKHDDFAFTQDYKNFDFVSKGVALANENKKPIIAERDSYIIFPKMDIGKGKIACYLAK